MEKKVDLIIVGCGGRGMVYSNYVKRNPERARVVAVAEPRDYYRDLVGDLHGIPPERRFRSWEEASGSPVNRQT